MSAHVLLNLLNKLGKRDQMRAWQTFYLFFRNMFDKFNKTGAEMLDSIYHMSLKLLWSHIFGVKKAKILSLCTQRCYERYK